MYVCVCVCVCVCVYIYIHAYIHIFVHEYISVRDFKKGKLFENTMRMIIPAHPCPSHTYPRLLPVPAPRCDDGNYKLVSSP